MTARSIQRVFASAIVTLAFVFTVLPTLDLNPQPLPPRISGPHYLELSSVSFQV
jgi:hypothetical protein